LSKSRKQKEKGRNLSIPAFEKISQIAGIYGAPRAVIPTVPKAFVFATKWNLRIIEI